MSLDNFEETQVKNDYGGGVEEVKFDVDKPIIGVIVDIKIYLYYLRPFAESELR